MKAASVILIVIVLVTAATLLAGCSAIDSGPTVTKTYDFTGFTGVEAGSAFKVDIVRSENFSISVTLSEKIADRLNVTKTGDTLHIDFKEPVLNFRGRPLATITLPDLRSLDLSGATEVTAKGFKSSNNFNLEVSGASGLDMDMETGNFKADISGASKINGYLKAASSDINVTGASRITLTGSSGDITIDISGASRASLDNFAVGNAFIQLSGAGQASMLINGNLDANLSGASRLVYSGKPTLGKLDVTGGSTLKQK